MRSGESPARGGEQVHRQLKTGTIRRVLGLYSQVTEKTNPAQKPHGKRDDPQPIKDLVLLAQHKSRSDREMFDPLIPTFMQLVELNRNTIVPQLHQSKRTQPR